MNKNILTAIDTFILDCALDSIFFVCWCVERIILNRRIKAANIRPGQVWKPKEDAMVLRRASSVMITGRTISPYKYKVLTCINGTMTEFQLSDAMIVESFDLAKDSNHA